MLAQQRDLAGAEQRFEQALTVDPSLARAHAHLGSVLLATNQAAAAASEFRKAVDGGDTSTVTASQFGRALLLIGRVAEAVPMLESRGGTHAGRHGRAVHARPGEAGTG